MATTGKGYPYPIGTDRVMDGDDAIRALAEAVDTKLGIAASGSYSQSITTAQAVNNVAVTFPVGRFTAVPAVTVARLTGMSWSGMPFYYHATAVTASGFNSSGWSNTTGGAASMVYLAIQAP